MFFSGWLDKRQDHQTFAEFRFLVEPSDTVVAKEGEAILHCEASTGDDYPKPTVKWKRDGQSLKFPDFSDLFCQTVSFNFLLKVMGLKAPLSKLMD